VAAITTPAHGTAVATANGSITYTPAAGFFGTDTFTYTAEDPSGATATAIVTVTVRNAAPIAVNDSLVARPGILETLAVLANDTDPNTGQARRVASVGTAAKGTVTLHADGTVTYRTTETSGTDTFDYVLTDDLGLTDAATVTLTIDAAPAATADDITTGPGTAVDIAVLSNDSDPESRPLTVVSATKPGHGAAVVAGNRIRYTPASGFFGADTFSYTIRDAAGNSASATVTVHVANAAPIAPNHEAAMLANHSIDMAVLDDDSDPNPGQTLTIVQVGTPSHGTATIVDGKIRYTPTVGYAGTDTFTYTVSDGNGGTATATVNVTISDGTPVALADNATTPYTKAVKIAVLDNDLDPNGGLAVIATGDAGHGSVTSSDDSVVYTPAAGFSGKDTFTYTAKDIDAHEVTATVTVTVGTPPTVPNKAVAAKPGKAVSVKLPTTDENGRPVTITAVGEAKHGTVKLNADGTVSYTPDKGFSGVDSFSYEVVDADGNVATATITVTVAGANQAPAARNDRVSVPAGGSVVIRPKANDSDPNGDQTTVTRISRPKHGTAVLNANGTVTYAPADGFAGTDTFTYTISDGHGGTATATVTITVAAAAAGGGTGGGRLAVTGGNVVSIGITGALVLLIGGAMVVFGGRGTPMPVALTGHGNGRHRPGRHRVG
jgi:VCBS repeat-containing protein